MPGLPPPAGASAVLAVDASVDAAIRFASRKSALPEQVPPAPQASSQQRTMYCRIEIVRPCAQRPASVSPQPLIANAARSFLCHHPPFQAPNRHSKPSNRHTPQPSFQFPNRHSRPPTVIPAQAGIHCVPPTHTQKPCHPVHPCQPLIPCERGRNAGRPGASMLKSATTPHIGGALCLPHRPAPMPASA